MAINEDLLLMNTSHDIGLRRLQTEVQEDVLKLYREQQRVLNNRIRNEYFRPGSRQSEKLRNLRKIITKQIPLINTRIRNRLGVRIDETGLYEAEYQTNQLERITRSNIRSTLPVPISVGFNTTIASSGLIKSAIRNNAFQGQHLNNWFSNLSVTNRNGLNREMRISLFQGEGRRAVDNRIRNISNLNQRRVQALSRTAFTHAVNQAREINYKENGVEVLRYTAILDGRTTLICGSLDGSIFKLKEDRPLIPQHLGCRSTYLAQLSEGDFVKERIQILDTRTSRRISMQLGQVARANGTTLRAERLKWARRVVGRTSGRTNFNAFLKSAPNRFQRAYLGESRFRLYETGRLNVGDFVERTTGRKLTLSELRIKDKRAFTLAGL